MVPDDVMFPSEPVALKLRAVIVPLELNEVKTPNAVIFVWVAEDKVPSISLSLIMWPNEPVDI